MVARRYDICPERGTPFPCTISVLSLPDGVPHWGLVAEFLRLRKKVFIDQKDWNLTHVNGVEFEQYDTLLSCYIIAHRGSEVLGGGRLRRTDERTGQHYTYMINDAHKGMLPGMPSGLCFQDPPVHPDWWEFTRFAVKDNNPGVADGIMRVCNAYLYDMGAKHCLFLGPPAFLRFARHLGRDATPLGPVVGNKDGRFLAFSCEVTPPVYAQSLLDADPGDMASC